MVNASLNWASIVGIALAVCGAGLYFLRSFKPALARDYDVFFAAIGLLCGGILFFQGWRLDPILQFGQFLLAGTTVFFAYESVRLRGVATDQARRSSYFDDEVPSSRMPEGSYREDWNDSYDQFEDNPPLRRRFTGRQDQESSRNDPQDDFYGSRRSSRAAIPEEAASRRRRPRGEQTSWSDNSEKARRMARFGQRDEPATSVENSFGERRNMRQEQRRGSRPSANSDRTTRRTSINRESMRSMRDEDSKEQRGIPKGSPMRNKPEDAAFSPVDVPYSSREVKRTPRSSSNSSMRDSQQKMNNSSRRPSSKSRPRDNSSRFDN